MNTMKKTVLFLLVVSLMMGVCGCMSNYEQQKAAALEHLEEKYGKTFEIESFTARNMDMPYDLYIMKDAAGNNFSLTVRYAKDGKTEIRDGYYGIAKAEEYQKQLRDVLDRHFVQYKLFTVFTAGYFDNRYDKDYPLAEALKENNMQFFSNNYLFIDGDTAAKTDPQVYEQICSELEQRGLTLYLAIHSVTGEQLQSIDEAEEAERYLPEDYRNGPVFEKTVG